MLRGISAILLPLGMLAVAAGFAFVLSTSKTIDPKFTLLDSLLRLVSHQWTDSQHRHAA